MIEEEEKTIYQRQLEHIEEFGRTSPVQKQINQGTFQHYFKNREISYEAKVWLKRKGRHTRRLLKSDVKKGIIVVTRVNTTPKRNLQIETKEAKELFKAVAHSRNIR